MIRPACLINVDSDRVSSPVQVRVSVLMAKKILLYFLLVLAGNYPYTQVFAGLFDRTPSCEQSAEKLLDSGYQYYSNLLLVSDDAQHLAAFVVFYKLKKVKGSFMSRTNLTMKLFRYQREGDNYTLLSEQGNCEKYFDFEHHRAVMDKDQNIYFYYRKGNSFSYWPTDSQLKIKNHPVSGVNLSLSDIAIDRETGLIYATYDQRIVRQRQPGDFSFEPWFRFDGLLAAGKDWNPFRLRVAAGQLWVSMVIFNEGGNFSQVYEYWILNKQGGLVEKKTAVEAYTSFYPGSPAIGLRLDFVAKKSAGAGPGSKKVVLSYVNSVTGHKTRVVRISEGKSDLSLSGTGFSAKGTLFSIYNLYKDEAKAVLRLVRYHPNAGKSKILLPLLSAEHAIPSKNKGTRKFK